jgi:hypothetical protein
MTAENRKTWEAIDRLVDEYRDQCLWFLRSDYYPSNLQQRLRVLDYIQQRGDRAAYQKADEARRWLLRESSEASAAS